MMFSLHKLSCYMVIEVFATYKRKSGTEMPNIFLEILKGKEIKVEVYLSCLLSFQ